MQKDWRVYLYLDLQSLLWLIYLLCVQKICWLFQYLFVLLPLSTKVSSFSLFLPEYFCSTKRYEGVIYRINVSLWFRGIGQKYHSIIPVAVEVKLSVHWNTIFLRLRIKSLDVQSWYASITILFSVHNSYCSTEWFIQFFDTDWHRRAPYKSGNLKKKVKGISIYRNVRKLRDKIVSPVKRNILILT